MNQPYKNLKYACYMANITMSVISNMSPLLFTTFHSLYGISYTLLGFLVLINYTTQLTIDLIFSIFSHKFNISKVVKLMPIIAIIGLLLYASAPFIFSGNIFVGLVIGTIIFSASSGMSEVLVSPIVAEIPSDNPEREMSKLHSVYAWGVVGLIIFGTIFIAIFGNHNWYILSYLTVLIPFIGAILFFSSKIPVLNTPKRAKGALKMMNNKMLWVCVLAIFFGGACELGMAQWCSGYLEQALSIPKIVGDIFGTAMFAVMLGLGRSIYGKYGKNLEKVLLISSIGTFFCYLCAVVFTNPFLGLVACVFTGLSVSMLWPGTLVVASNRVSEGGVLLFALMAAGGDLGSALSPQIIGGITDRVSSYYGSEQIGMKCGLAIGMIFAIACISFHIYFFITKKKEVD